MRDGLRTHGMDVEPTLVETIPLPAAVPGDEAVGGLSPLCVQ